MVYKDNSGTVEQARLPKVCLWTNHINNYLHHLRSYTLGQAPQITVRVVSTEQQIGEMFTKPLSVLSSFEYCSLTGEGSVRIQGKYTETVHEGPHLLRHTSPETLGCSEPCQTEY